MSAPQTHPETYYAGAYWGPRKETADECARRTSNLLDLLAPCDPFLAHWYKPARSLKEELRQPLESSDLVTLGEMFRKGVNREKGGPVFEDLGFSVWFGNGGGSYDRASLRIRCGDYCGASPNACVLSLPTLGRGANADRVLTASVLTGAVRSMVHAWEPDWAVAMSHAYRDLEEKTEKTDVQVGWVTYLARHRGTVPPLPAPVRVEPIEDRGTLVILTPERFTAANAEHVSLAHRVRELLVRAGLIRLSEPGSS